MRTTDVLQKQLRESEAAKAKLLATLRFAFNALVRETVDHKPSVATGLPCKCFLCEARRAI